MLGRGEHVTVTPKGISVLRTWSLYSTTHSSQGTLHGCHLIVSYAFIYSRGKILSSCKTQKTWFTCVFMCCIHLFSVDPPSHNQDDDHYSTH